LNNKEKRMGITQVPIRACIEVGGAIVETPYVLSFNVHRRRGSPATFDASIKVKGSLSGSIGSSGGGIAISAGTGGVHKIFTGIIRGAKITPCWDDPSYIIVTLSGDDTLSLLKGKKYSRRCRGTKSTFGIITGVTRSGLKSGKFAYATGESFEFEPGNINVELPNSAHGINSSLKGLEVSGAEGADLKNNLGVKIDTTLIDTGTDTEQH
jgi:hypothetical protein